ncbi:TauD/TfdA dioxygenase family protein [Francisella adeliensis]|uniref:TauD/TfdA family dioxygenase n=1 Tax=Francisella adeliensis TaxID=2007306 RepID=A0A2Z4XYE6_9GAMM|nr:TauD/TfdA family dioxygenase [Francisella adeliensis]AXA33770.1 hypothetical protein CDH04_04785 [Francisella adeliensis]MBK2085668.1 TauD/TfdA family dioxygenase [Francisella adeliensis]MBK2097546.1 TauD/TfdA family dioxygenase [Francisella adeliensis]QIW12004.1 TauD/TfdA family dioxygenase [Francisella adeliensis]QIW13879.1 TauD/TfdA family dioxygenase [Francisella adeliensis]
MKNLDSNITKSTMGYVITDIDLKNLDQHDLTKVQKAVSKHGLISIKSQKLLQPEELDTITKKLGNIIKLPAGLAFDNQVTGLETVVRVSNIRKDGTLIEGHDAAEHWHQDGDFRPGKEIYIWNMLHAHIVPKKGGQTGFLDAQRILDDMPEWLLEFFKNHQSLMVAEKVPDFDKEAARKFKEVLHDCIQIHPVTNEPSLYLGSISIIKIDGIPQLLWNEIREYLMERFNQECYRYIHQWEPGDTLIWDNTLVYHRSMGGYGNDPRLLYRTQALMFQ